MKKRLLLFIVPLLYFGFVNAQMSATVNEMDGPTYQVPLQPNSCIPIANFPWEDGFESITVTNTLPPCWAATNLGTYVFTQTSNYYTSNRVARTGTRAAYFGKNCNDYIFTPKFELQGGKHYNFSFWYITDGSYGWESLKVGVYSDQVSDSLVQQLVELTNVNNQTYQRLSGFFTPTEDGVYCFGVHCLANVFPWYLTVDDFQVLELSCFNPTNLTVSNITANSAEINFLPGQAGDSVFKVMWKPAGVSTWEEDLVYDTTSFVLTELLPQTPYQVRVFTRCVDSTYSNFIEEEFCTLCGHIFPYIENFDTYGTGEGSFPTCWSYKTNHTTFPVCTTAYNVSPPNSLHVHSFGYKYTILSTPEIDESVDISELQVSFYVRGAAGQSVQLGVMENPALQNTFVPVQIFTVSNSFQQYTGYLFDYTGTGRYVALKVASSPSVNFYFDNFVLDIADCFPVFDLAVTDVGAASAIVSWTSHGTPDSFNIEVTVAGNSSGVLYSTTDNHFTLTGLSELTDYIVSVTANYSGEEGPSVSETFTTTCAWGGSVVVGTPEATTSVYGFRLPSDIYYGVSYSQQIFDAAELSEIVDTIHGIGFQYFYGNSYTRNMEIYLGHTDQINYASSSDYVSGTHFIKVFDGHITLTNTGKNNWVNINFTTPFVYDHERNLVVTVIDKTGSYTASGDKFRTHATNGNKSIFFYRQGSTPFTLSPSGMGGTAPFRNNVKFIAPCEDLSCYPPDLVVDHIESSSMVFQIAPVASETAWEVEYKLSEETDWISLGIVNTTTNTISNLDFHSQYDLRVRSVCDTFDMSNWKEVSFTTKIAPPASIPYFCDFEDPVENLNWNFKNSGQTNQWYIGNASNNPDVNGTEGGANALYISNDGGAGWAYSAGTGNNSKSYAYRDFEIPSGVEELRLSIYWIANGNGATDMLRLYWLSPDADIDAGSLPSGALGTNSALAATYGAHVNDIDLRGMTYWQEHTTFSINDTQFPDFAGKTWRLYFLWRNDVTSAIDQQPPAVVDNITLEAITCSSPIQLEVMTASEDSVALIWTETGNATSWKVQYRKSTEPTWSTIQASSTLFVVRGLDHSSTYVFRVQSDCGGGDVSGYSNVVEQKTLCVPITDLPWEDSFESVITTGEFPPCWLPTTGNGILTTQTANLGSYNRNARSGTRFATISRNANNRLYTPGFELQGGVSYDFSFWYVTDQLSGWIELQSGVYSSQSSTTPIQVLAVVNNPVNSYYEKLLGTFTPDTSGVYYFGIQFQANSSPMYLTLDDFAVCETPECTRPSNVVISNITPYTIDMAWGEEGDATVWDIEYGPHGFTSGILEQADTIPFTLTGLDHSTTYQVRVRAVCDIFEYSEWTPRFDFTTSCSMFDLPYSEDFALSPPCWTQTYSGGITSEIWTHSLTGNQAGGITAGELQGSRVNGVGVTRLISPLINFENVDAAELSFRHFYSSNYGSGPLLKVQCSPDLVTWTDLSFSHSGASFPPRTTKIHFNPLADSLYLAWVIDGNHMLMYDWYVDDISIVEILDCLPPTGINHSNLTTTSVHIEWSDFIAADSCEIEYGVTGFTQGTGTTLLTTTDSLTITGLTPSTCYDFYVRTICISGEMSDWSSKYTFCTEQIPVHVPFIIDFELPSGFAIANNPFGANWYIGNATGVNNTSGGNNGLYVSGDNGVTNAYTDSPALVWAYRDIYFTPSTTNYILTFDWKCLGEASDYFSVHIGPPSLPVANTTGEVTLPAGVTDLGTVINQKSSWQTKTYTLPVADYSAQTKRLYFSWRNNDQLVNPPSAAIDNIEVTSVGIIVCLTPTNLQVGNITDETAVVTWTAGGSETSWKVEYKAEADTTWTVQIVNVPTYDIIGLQPSTNYQVRVKSLCGNGAESPYTTVVSFTTAAPPCVAPTNLAISNISSTGGTATWTAGSFETSWQIEYKTAAATDWTTQVVNIPTYEMTDLQPSTDYQVRVKSLCEGGAESDYTEPVSFTTEAIPTYTIVATASPGGTITPFGNITVNEGESQTFTFTPNDGYQIEAVLVDDQPQIPVPESYMFENIQANHTIHVDFTVGIDENELSRYVTLYPNPTQYLIDLKIDRDYLGATECHIYDMYGRLTRVLSIEEEITTIDVSDFASGVYLVRLTTEQGQISKRFVKQ